MHRKIGLLVVLVWVCFSAFAQVTTTTPVPMVDYSEPREYEVAGVTVTGVQGLDPLVLATMSGLNVGSKVQVPGDQLSKVVDNFWRQGLFSDVKVVVSRIEGEKIWFEIQLKERPRISDWEFVGFSKAAIKDLKDPLNLKKELQVTESLMQSLERVVKKHYSDKGYMNAELHITQKPDTTRYNRVHLVLEVDKKQKVKIGAVNFIDNEVFRDARLKRVMKKTKALGLNFLKSHKFNEANFEEDKVSLFDFYNKHGFRDYQLLMDTMVFIKSNRLAVNIRIHEGDPYYFRNITWVGNTKYSTDILNKNLKLRTGDVYDQVGMDKRLSQDEDAVTNLYSDFGYLRAQIIPIEMKVENDSVDVELRVIEGPQYHVGNVGIEGNETTNEHVVRRELRVKPGDLFSKAKLIRDLRELANLGYFDKESITPDVLPNDENETVDVIYRVEEVSTSQFELSAGYGGSMFIGRIGVQFNNFATSGLKNIKNWRPVPMGDGQSLGISFQTNGSYYRSYNISFVEPWLGGKKPNSLSVSLYHSLLTEGTSSYSATSILKGNTNHFYKSTGISVGLGRRLKWPDDYFTLMNEVSYQRYEAKDWSGSSYYSLPFKTGASNSFTFGTTLGRNSQDAIIYPTSGSVFSLGLTLTPPWSLFSKKDFSKMSTADKYKWIEYHKWSFKGLWYMPLFLPKLILVSNYQLGYLGYYNKDIGPSPYEGFDVGGSGMQGYQLYGVEVVSLRGYQESAVTPYSQKQIRAGNIYSKASLEIRYPVMLDPRSSIYLLGFVEGGNAWSDSKKFNPFELKRSAGFGIRAFLPMFGMLGLDWGYGFDNVPGGIGTNGAQLQFSMGQSF